MYFYYLSINKNLEFKYPGVLQIENILLFIS